MGAGAGAKSCSAFSFPLEWMYVDHRKRRDPLAFHYRLDYTSAPGYCQAISLDPFGSTTAMHPRVPAPPSPRNCHSLFSFPRLTTPSTSFPSRFNSHSLFPSITPSRYDDRARDSGDAIGSCPQPFNGPRKMMTDSDTFGNRFWPECISHSKEQSTCSRVTVRHNRVESMAHIACTMMILS